MQIILIMVYSFEHPCTIKFQQLRQKLRSLASPALPTPRVDSSISSSGDHTFRQSLKQKHVQVVEGKAQETERKKKASRKESQGREESSTLAGLLREKEQLLMGIDEDLERKRRLLQEVNLKLSTCDCSSLSVFEKIPPIKTSL